MKTITKTYQINAAPLDVWNALTDPTMIDAWGGGPAKMTEKAGGKFSLWGGDIYGKNTKARHAKELVQEWYAGDWDAPSIVSFTLDKKDKGTSVLLVHTNIPDDEVKKIDKGWDDTYMNPLKELVEK